MRLIGIKCRNLKANKWERTERQIVGYLSWPCMDARCLWGRILNYYHIDANKLTLLVLTDRTEVKEHVSGANRGHMFHALRNC